MQRGVFYLSTSEECNRHHPHLWMKGGMFRSGEIWRMLGKNVRALKQSTNGSRIPIITRYELLYL